MEALVAEATKDSSPEALPTTTAINKVESSLSKRRLAIWRYLAVFEPQQLDELHKQVGMFKDIVNNLRANDLNDAVKALLDQVARLRDEYDTTGEDVIRQACTATEVYFGEATQMRTKAGQLLDIVAKGIATKEAATGTSVNADTDRLSFSLIVSAAITLASDDALDYIHQPNHLPINCRNLEEHGPTCRGQH